MPPPITLARRTLHGFRTVAKKHLNLKGRDPGPPVRLHADEDGGARLTTCGPDGRGVSLHIPGDRPPADLVLPISLLSDAGAAKAGEVRLADADGGNAVVANWDERGVPRSTRGTLEKKDRDRAAKFVPPEIEDWSDPGKNFGELLRAACEVTDADSGRYALGCVRLDPAKNCVEATDSHHLLIARGFSFPFAEPVLLPAPHALSAAPLRREGVRVAFVPNGAAAGTGALLCGDWTVWSPEVRDARFPELDRVVPATDGKATATLTDRDVRFLLDRLPSLPGAGDERKPITLDLTGGELLVRAREDGAAAVELATSPSETRGRAACLCDRRFLVRALSLSCTRVTANGPEEPVRMDAPGDDAASITVVFATLAGDPVPADGAVRVVADAPETTHEEATATPPAATARGRVTHTTPKRTPTPMPKNRIAEHADDYRSNGHVNGTNGHAVRGDDRPDAAPDHDELLERVSALGSTLSEAAGEARSLATDLRKLKRRNRAVTGALAGLKKLGSLVA